jgi:hypothetical protein
MKRKIFTNLYTFINAKKKHKELGDKYEDEMINIVLYPN